MGIPFAKWGAQPFIVHPFRYPEAAGARVTQIMNLLDLPKGILAHVSSLTTRDDLRRFSERKLRIILAITGAAARLAAFRQLRHQCPQ